jgi:hypothetical protein
LNELTDLTNNIYHDTFVLEMGRKRYGGLNHIDGIFQHAASVPCNAYVVAYGVAHGNQFQRLRKS